MKLLNLASNDSFWRGIDYYHGHRTLAWEMLSGHEYQGKVRGNGNNVYLVKVDAEHPRKSSCTCPFADGRRVICKHMIALYLEIFPEKEAQMMKYIEEQNRLYEMQLEQEIQRQKDEIHKYVMSLPKAELQRMLIERMINEIENEYY